jgi:cell fate regulator YaaT (PSP1 superfamily)
MIEVVGVALGNKSRAYYFSPNGLELKVDEEVIVSTERGHQYGKVVFEKCEIEKEKIKGDIKPVIRKANEEDIKKYQNNIKDAKKALIKCRTLVEEKRLNMHITNAEYTFNREQLMFRFLSDTRIDFRELAKDLASIYHTRIELHQIGVRDKAKEVGGIGPCGLVLCCHKFLNDFDTVSINMAKNQGIALNPSKINGQCGRLLCCLKFEDDCYKECKKNMPRIGEKMKTDQGEGKIISLDIIRNTARVLVPDNGVIEVKLPKNESN